MSSNNKPKKSRGKSIPSDFSSGSSDDDDNQAKSPSVGIGVGIGRDPPHGGKDGLVDSAAAPPQVVPLANLSNVLDLPVNARDGNIDPRRVGGGEVIVQMPAGRASKKKKKSKRKESDVSTAPARSPFWKHCVENMASAVIMVFFLAGVSVIEAALVSVYVVPYAVEIEFPIKDPSKRASNVGYMLVGIIPMYVAMYSLITQITHGCVADTEAGPYWKRQSMKLIVLLLMVVCALILFVMTSAPDYNDLINYIICAICFFCHAPVNFYFIARSLDVGMVKPCVMILLEFAFSYIVFLPSLNYRTSEAFPWTAPWIYSGTSMATRYVADKCGVPYAMTARLQVCSLFFAQFFSRIAQSKTYGNVGYTIGLEFYMVAFAIFCRASLYQRFAMANHLADCKCAGILKAEKTERSRQVASMTNLTEIVYDHMCFMVSFVLCFCAMPPAHLSSGEVVGEFVCCLLIQMCGNIFILLLVSYYEGIALDVYAIAKEVKGELLFWWTTGMAGFLIFLRGIGQTWDPTIK